jgi:hypothetical protein
MEQVLIHGLSGSWIQHRTIRLLETLAIASTPRRVRPSGTRLHVIAFVRPPLDNLFQPLQHSPISDRSPDTPPCQAV